MKTDCKGCFGAANNDCERCEEERGQEIFFTDLTPYFTKDIKDGVLTGAWVIEEGEQKELILKFDEHISGIEKNGVLAADRTEPDRDSGAAERSRSDRSAVWKESR